jgi:hypothetical protein
VAFFAGGATFTAGRAAAGGRKAAIWLRAIGSPGCAAKACCCLAKGTGGGGGVFFATTCRAATAAGGALTCPAVAACNPITDSRVGAIATRALMGADAISFALTCTRAAATGCALVKACCGTTMTAPCTLRLA